MKFTNKIWILVAAVFLFDVCLIGLISMYNKKSPVEPVKVQQEIKQEPINEIKKVLPNGKRSDRVFLNQHEKIKFRNVNDNNIKKVKQFLADNGGL